MSNTSTAYTLLSKKGMKELKKAIAQLEHDQNEALQSLRELDKSHDREGRMARIEKLAELETIESELADKNMTLANAKLMPTRRARLKVAIGSAVDLMDQSGRLFRYTIVDSIEADPTDGRISANSPLGSLLLGKSVKEFVEWGSGLKQRQLQLVRIH